MNRSPVWVAALAATLACGGSEGAGSASAPGEAANPAAAGAPKAAAGGTEDAGAAMRPARSCDPPFRVDAAGRKVYRMECLSP